MIILGRAANVYPLSYLANLTRRRSKITPLMQFVMFFSGTHQFQLSTDLPSACLLIPASPSLVAANHHQACVARWRSRSPSIWATRARRRPC